MLPYRKKLALYIIIVFYQCISINCGHFILLLASVWLRILGGWLVPHNPISRTREKNLASLLPTKKFFLAQHFS
jgi:hypothetical protein